MPSCEVWPIHDSHESAYAYCVQLRGLVAPISLIPVTLRSVKHTMQQFGYLLFDDDGRVLIWKKGGPVPKGLEETAETWPPVVSKQYPTFTAEGHDQLVYDRSDVTDLIVEITGRGRTDGARAVAILRSETRDPDLAPADIVDILCLNCGKKTKVVSYAPNLKTVSCKCPHCGHEDTRTL